MQEASKILEYIKRLEAQIEQIQRKGLDPLGPYESEKVDKLHESLANAQTEMKPVERDSDNPFFKSKYSSWTAMAMATRPILNKHGLSFDHVPRLGPDGNMYLVGWLGHKSGQFKKGVWPIKPDKDNIQGQGSAQSYAMRYLYKSMVGVMDNEWEDDGEAAMPPREHTEGAKLATEKQVNTLNRILQSTPEYIDKILNKYEIESLDELTVSQASEMIGRLMQPK